MPKFDRFTARDYATKYARTGNPDYPAFDNDCTSFVSQCMLAGGWTEIGGSFWDRKDDGVWWYGKSSLTRASYTWGGAHNFSKFFAESGRGTGCNRDELEVGDVVQIARNRHVFHTMVVTEVAPDIKLSYHTTNTLKKSLALIEPDYATADGFTFLYWKILSHPAK